MNLFFHNSLVYDLVAALATTEHEFCGIIRERNAAAWTERQRNAPSGSLACFAKHLCRDEAAFLIDKTRDYFSGLLVRLDMESHQQPLPTKMQIRPSLRATEEVSVSHPP